MCAAKNELLDFCEGLYQELGRLLGYEDEDSEVEEEDE